MQPQEKELLDKFIRLINGLDDEEANDFEDVLSDSDIQEWKDLLSDVRALLSSYPS